MLEAAAPAPAPESPPTAIADGHQMARGAAANALVLLAANFRGIFTFLIARLLGEAALGRFSVIFSTVDLLSKPGMIGFDSSIVPLLAPRAAVGDGDNCRRIFRLSVATAAISSLVLMIIGIPLLAWLAQAKGLEVFRGSGIVMLLALPAFAIGRISTGASRGLLKMRHEFYSRGLTETWVTTGVFVIAIAVGLREVAPSLAVVVGTAAGATVGFALASRALASLPQRKVSEPVSLTSLLRLSWPTAGSNLLNVLVTQADVLLLAAYVGRAPGVTVESFGVFCACAEVAVGLRKVRQVFDPIFAPVVATRAASHRTALRDTVAGPGRWVLAAQLPLVGGLLLSSGAVLSIYGASFRQGALWLALLGLAHGANTFAGLVETLLMIERPGLNLVNAAVTVASQIVAGIVLIPILGVTGAALAMCLGFVVQGALRFAEVRHVFGWSWPWASLGRPIAAFLMAMTPAALLRVFGGPHAEIPSGVLFMILYAVAWRWLGMDPADVEVWRRLVRRRRVDESLLDAGGSLARQ